ncbi:MAG: hypothetical protein H6581_04255 [Bacteroidia bacterium]|nr:hypothetical protein [Bacteroidia bacterium]
MRQLFLSSGFLAFAVLFWYGCGDGKKEMAREGVKPADKKIETANKRTYWDNDPEFLKETYYVLQDSQFCKHGPYKKYTKEGVVNMEYMYELGNPSGVVKDYYPDGSLYTEYTYKNGEPHGEFTWYYPNGNIKLTGSYEHGKYTDTIKEYDESGKLTKATTDYSDYE